MCVCVCVRACMLACVCVRACVCVNAVLPHRVVPPSLQVMEDLSADAEADSNHYMAVLIEALFTLGMTGDAVEAIQSRMQREFLLIIAIERASIQVTRT